MQSVGYSLFSRVRPGLSLGPTGWVRAWGELMFAGFPKPAIGWLTRSELELEAEVFRGQSLRQVSGRVSRPESEWLLPALIAPSSR